jgi:divalent metal cation (Fe/Co/Zn/Cd) transporter
MKSPANISLFSLFVALAVFGLNWLVWQLTGAQAFRSAALEKIVNIVSALAVLAALWLERRAGAARLQRLVAMAIGAMIMATGTGIVLDTLTGGQVSQVGMSLTAPALATALIAMALNTAWGTFLVRTGRRKHIAAFVADGRHLQSDVLVSLLALLATASHLVILDRAIALVIGLFLLRNGLQAIRVALCGPSAPARKGSSPGPGRNLVPPACPQRS